MSKLAVIYWSGTGNTEAMAMAVGRGPGRGRGGKRPHRVRNQRGPGRAV